MFSPYGQNKIIDGVEIGIANPNLAISSVLQPFSSLSGITGSHPNLTFESLSSHAHNQFANFKAQVSQDGLPPTFQFLDATLPVVLSSNATYDQGIAVSLPSQSTPNPELTISIPISSPSQIPANKPNPSSRGSQYESKCEIQIDIARRSTCYLPASYRNASRRDANAGKTCANPNEIAVYLRLDTADSAPRLSSTVKILKSRFNVEFGPSNVRILLPRDRST